MMNNHNLLVKPQQNPIYQNFTADEVGWKYLNFGARLMQKGETWEHDTTGHEMAIVILGGNYKVESDKGNWEVTNGRKDVFSGIAHTLYLSRHTKFTLTATSDTLDIAYSWVETDQDFAPYLKQPQEAAIELRGGDNANRQINSLIQPGFPCHKIVCVEVYTPSGNWSSFPAHKHDERIVDTDGKLIEAELEEIYFYKFQSPQAYAIQQVYTYDRSLDEIIRARNNEAVLVPKGYHPVAACHGYHAYYLNFLAGSDQVLTATNDPDHEWIYGSWKTQDARLPLVTADMNV